MAFISLKEVSLAFGGPLVFDQLTLCLEPGERVALLGRNGAGKTTLMKVLSGQLGVDRGEIVTQKGIRVAYLAQEIPADLTGTVFDIVLSGLGKQARLLSDYHHVINQLHTDHTPELMRKLDVLQSELDRTGSWDISNQVDEVISRMKLDPESDFEKMSGGQKRRVLLAKALVFKPEVLLLDEPTNHLDIDSINWLESFLLNYSGTIFFVTHDRAFMTKLSTRILELDRGKLFSWACDYETFLERKKMALDVEESQRLDFSRKLSQEEAWIRRGVKARRTRNEGRVKVLERMRKEKKAERQVLGKVRMKTHEAESSGRLVIKASHVGFSYKDNCLIRDFSTQIMRGDKIGVIGPNGSGKTTLLRILLRELEAQKGKVRFGTKLEISYYDQLREQLDGEKTLIQNICGEGENVIINGKSKHIISYLQEFLFSPDRARTPVKVLSGGERNRLLLARLFTKPSNVLVMDEPTNDLDIETLELLEELLLDYSGTLLLVSHDRAFLNNVVTSTIVLEGEGEIGEYAGGYDDWLNQRKPAAPQQSATKKKTGNTDIEKPRASRKRSFKEQRELEALIVKIEKLEIEQEKLCGLLSDADFYRKEATEIVEVKANLEAVEDELLVVFKRWEQLEELEHN